MSRVVGMDAGELDAYRANPVWPARVAAAPTILRELDARADPSVARGASARSGSPSSRSSAATACRSSHAATTALDERLADGRIVVIPGARHAAHHTHPDALVDGGPGVPADLTASRDRTVRD